MIREMTKKLFNDEAGVSPIVATLVLIVVAIAGAAAVGTIMGSFSSDVSDNANAGETVTTSSTEIVVAGSTTVLPASEFLAKEYMKENKGIKITVQGGGSDAGIASAGMGIVDIGAASKYMDSNTQGKYPELEEHIIGGSAVVVIVNNDAALWTTVPTSVTKAELAALYDATSAAAQIGGTAAPAGTLVYQRAEGSGTEETFAQAVFGSTTKNVDKALDNTNTVVKTAQGNDALIKAVAGSSVPAIGFADYGLVKIAIDSGSKLAILPVDIDDAGAYVATGSTSSDNVKAGVKARLAGTETTASAATTKYYPVELCRPLVYLVQEDASSTVNDFLQFAQSPGAIASFTKAGYFGVSELQ